MWIDGYQQAARGHVRELIDYLSSAETDALREQCRNLGEKGWIKWFDENRAEVIAYVRATPSQRKRKKAWQDPDKKGLLVLSAILHASRARSLLDGLANRLFDSGQSYRDMTALSGEVYLDVLLRDIPDWPFPDPNPFE